MQDGMYVDPETFRKQVVYLKNNFNLISLDKIQTIDRLDHRNDCRKPYCILTFDDGWKDFYVNAYPVLSAHNVSATVFLPTGFIGTAKRFWTDRLADIVYKMDDIGIVARGIDRSSNKIGKKIESIKGSVEFKLEEAIKALKSLPLEEIENVLDEMKEKWDVDGGMQAASFLSWEEAREMHKSGIVFFGSHTKSHRILTTISEDAVREELTQSKNKLLEERVVGPSFIPFAYPNGNYNDRIASLVEEAGYHLALTTESGWNRVTNRGTGSYRLKRVGIHQDMTSTNAMMACRIYGSC
jgi:peptidoglycan/xylan/chitin deacetylase (PgdA/CDA1 family)